MRTFMLRYFDTPHSSYENVDLVLRDKFIKVYLRKGVFHLACAEWHKFSNVCCAYVEG